MNKDHRSDENKSYHDNYYNSMSSEEFEVFLSDDDQPEKIHTKKDFFDNNLLNKRD